MIGSISVLLFDLATDFGATVSTEDGNWQASLSSVFILTVVGLAGYHFMNGVGIPPANKSYLLVNRPAKDVAGGQLLFRYCETILPVLVPTLAFFLGIAVAVRSPLPIFGGIAAALTVNGLGTAAGYFLGLAVKGIVRRRGVSVWTGLLFGIPLFFIYIIFIYLGGISIAVERLQPVTVNSPFGWIADLAVVTTPDSRASPVRAFGALIIMIGLCFIAIRGTVRAAEYTWYADKPAPASGKQTGEKSDNTNSTTDLILDVVCPSPGCHGIARVTIDRVYRSSYLLFVSVGLLLLTSIPFTVELIRTGTIPWYTPWVVLYYGTFIVGLLHTLNILGFQGQTLPTLLTSQTSAAQVVNGHIISGAVIGVPLITLLVIVSGWLSQWNLIAVIFMVLATPPVLIVTAMVASGIGVRFPRYRRDDVATLVPPNKIAALLLSIPAAVTVVLLSVVIDSRINSAGGTIITTAFSIDQGIGERIASIVAVGGLAIVCVVAVISYRYARLSIDQYRIS